MSNLDEYSTEQLLAILVARVTKLSDKINITPTSDFKWFLRAYDVTVSLGHMVDNLSNTITAIKTDLSYKRIPDILTEMGVDSIKVDGRSYYLRVRMDCSIDPLRKQEAYDWLSSHDLGHLIQPNVNVKSLSSQLTSYIEEKGTSVDCEAIRIHNQLCTASRRA